MFAAAPLPNQKASFSACFLRFNQVVYNGTYKLIISLSSSKFGSGASKVLFSVMEKITLNRQELYELVWSEPMLAISRKYKISDTGFRKMCLRLGVPTPHPGYWRQIETGKKAKRAALPENFTRMQLTITLYKREEGAVLLTSLTLLQRRIEEDNAAERIRNSFIVS